MEILDSLGFFLQKVRTKTANIHSTCFHDSILILVLKERERGEVIQRNHNYLCFRILLKQLSIQTINTSQRFNQRNIEKL